MNKNRIFAISDIHGCSRTFEKLLNEVLELNKADRLILLGDYIDRGPDSKAVLDQIIKMKKSGYNLKILKGNHEEMMLNALENPDELKLWLLNGGNETLKSFGVRGPENVPGEYYELLRQMEYYYEDRDYIFVHAGLNFTLDDPYEDKKSMLWLRGMKLNPAKTRGKVVVHGHTPQPLNKVKESIITAKEALEINIDNGCFYGFDGFYGHLTAFESISGKLLYTRNIDMDGRRGFLF